MIDILLLTVTLVFIFFGLRDPAVALTGYFWADMLAPHRIGYGFISNLSISEWLAITCFLSMIIHFKKLGAPKSLFMPITMIIFLMWITLTTSWAHYPDAAWIKWDWAFKSVLFIILSFFIFHKEEHLELFMFLVLLCVAYYAIPIGLKVAIGGGGYGKALLHGARNHGLSESSTLAGMTVAMLPILIYLKNHSKYLYRAKKYRFLWYGTIAVLLVSVVGTYSRTGLFALFVLSLVWFLFGKHKLLTLTGLMLGAVFLLSIVSSEWTDRMLTMQDAESDSSALGRLVVWAWTFDYSKSVPLGGGFNSYLDNAGKLSAYSDATNDDIDESAKAFHNVFFEVLGEQGYPGLLMYVTMIGSAMFSLLITRHKTKKAGPELAKIHDAATALIIAFCCALATGLFVGIAYRPYIFFFLIFALIVEKAATNKIQQRKFVGTNLIGDDCIAAPLS